MKLKVCANLSFMFQETSSLLERYALAAKAGFRAVECAFPYNFTPHQVLTAMNNAKLQQVLINVYVGDVSKGELGFAAIPGQEEQFMASLKKAILYAKELKCSKIHIMSGTVAKVTDQHIKTYNENIQRAVDLLEQENIVGLIEPINPYSVPNYFMNNFDQGINLVKKINSPNLKLMMDLFHLQHIKGNLTNNIKEYLPYVGHIQVAQVPHRNEPDTRGEIDYRYVFGLLEELGYNGWIGLEYKPLNDTLSGLQWIKDFGLQLE